MWRGCPREHARFLSGEQVWQGVECPAAGFSERQELCAMVLTLKGPSRPLQALKLRSRADWEGELSGGTPASRGRGCGSSSWALKAQSCLGGQLVALLVVPQARAVVPELGRSSISKRELRTKFRSDLVLKQDCPALR